ncbi:MAG TPA: cytochrome P450 [Opitutaceae bacterium]|nr:cytochrome P450 [Opitutaceae bacterium]
MWPEKLPFWRAYRLTRGNGIGALNARLFEEPIVANRFLWFRSFFVNDPDGIRRILRDNAANYPKSPLLRRVLCPSLGEGLVTSEGETWRRHRRLMAPAFDRQNFAGYAPVMTGAALELAEEWARLPAGAEVDVSAAMARLTARVISRTMFSGDARGIEELLGASMERVQAASPPNLLDILGFPERLAGFRRLRLVRRQIAPLNDAIRRLVAARRQASSPGDDLLGRLLSARDEATGQGLTAQEIRDELVTIFMAGHDTTSLALTWTWYLLSQHPQVEEKLRAELRGALGGRAPTQADLEALPYTRMVLEESMRLYPPVFTISSRQAQAEDVVCGMKIPKGAFLFVMPWILHRHRKLWDHPDRFDPERFSPARSERRHRYAYLPFSAGPRVCIGAGFAMMEGILILAALAQRFRLRQVPGLQVEPRGLITLRAWPRLQMRLEPAG